MLQLSEWYPLTTTEILSNYGVSLALSPCGNRLVVGDNVINNLRGMVIVYQKNGDQWEQLGETLEGTANLDKFGTSVSISYGGSRVAVGAPQDFNGSGYVRVFEWTGTSWVQIGSDLMSKNRDNFGQSVKISLNGDSLAVGAPQLFSGNKRGFTRVYQFKNNIWEQLGSEIVGEFDNNFSGRALDLTSICQFDRLRLAIGEIGFSNGNGRVRIFEWTGSSWTKLGSDLGWTVLGGFAGSNVSFSYDGRRIAVGIPGFDFEFTNVGSVEIYQFTNGKWEQLGEPIVGEAMNDAVGLSLSFSGKGNRIVLGARKDSPNNTGATRVYEFSLGKWNKLIEFSGDSERDNNGSAVSLSGNTFVTSELRVGKPNIVRTFGLTYITNEC